MSPRRHLALVALLAATALPAGAQIVVPAPATVPPPMERVKLSGPRFGVTMLGGSILDSLAAHDVNVGRVITQFGWQFERQFYAVDGGPAAVTELVLLAGGLEQQTFLPSLTWLVGLRTPRGMEFGVGPNISVAGSSLAFAAGLTQRVGGLNIPVNVALVPGRTGARVSVLAGFTAR